MSAEVFRNPYLCKQQPVKVPRSLSNKVHRFPVSTEGRVDTNAIETGLEFRCVSVNSSVADKGKTNEPPATPQKAACSAARLRMCGQTGTVSGG